MESKVPRVRIHVFKIFGADSWPVAVKNILCVGREEKLKSGADEIVK